MKKKNIFARFVLTLAVIGTLGVVLIAVSRAGVSVLSLDGPWSSTGGAASIMDDNSASGGQFLEFDSLPEFNFSTSVFDTGRPITQSALSAEAFWRWPDQVNEQGAYSFSGVINSSYDHNGSDDDDFYWFYRFTMSNNSPGIGNVFIGVQNDLTMIDGDRSGLLFRWEGAGDGEAANGSILVPRNPDLDRTEIARQFDWLAGVDYQFSLALDSDRSDSQLNWWTMSVQYNNGASNVDVGSISTPSEWGLIVPATSYVERYSSQDSSCGSLPKFNTQFRGYSTMDGQGDTYTPSGVLVRTRGYTDCPNALKAEGLVDGYDLKIGG